MPCVLIDDKSSNKSSRNDGKNKERWQVHRMTEDYVNVVGDIMYPKMTFEGFGYIKNCPGLDNNLKGAATTTSSSSSGSSAASNNSTNSNSNSNAIPVSVSNLPLLSRVNTLGYLLNPTRRKNAIEMWSPYEIAIFEASITLHGKNFHKIQKHVSSTKIIANNM